MTYLRQHGTRVTPQSEPLPGQLPNSAGGHAWTVDQWARLRRFLILGSEGGSYYASERDLTAENVSCVHECAVQDGARTVQEIVAVSDGGLAPKNDPAIFALAVCAAAKAEATRRAALDALPQVCRIGTHLFQFATFVEAHRGWGRSLRRAVARWYTDKDPDALAYQVVKYRQRGTWSHSDLLRLAHPGRPKGDNPRTDVTAEHAAIFSWLSGKEAFLEDRPTLISAFEAAQKAETPRDTAKLIRNYKLPREALLTEHLNEPEVWEALLEQMPMTAMIRNLATMTRNGVIAPMSNGTKAVLDQLGDEDRIRKARVHPLQILTALAIYRTGHGMRSDTTWTPVAQIVDALDAAFYTAFGNVETTGKRWLLALDVSGSMAGGSVSGSPLSPREASAAMALVTAATEPNHLIHGFSHQFVPLPISPRQRLDDAVAAVSGLPFSATDCAIPMIYALQAGIEVDVFVVYTDSETWFGQIHPSQALALYREQTGINAKLIVVGMVSNGFTIADPNDAGMLDVVGFDTSVPNVMGAFATTV